MSNEPENIRISRVAAIAVAAAMRVAKAEMPEASERRLLLTVLLNAASSAGILRIDFDDVMNLVAGAYKAGLQQHDTPTGPLFDPRFEPCGIRGKARQPPDPNEAGHSMLMGDLRKSSKPGSSGG
jgi:hypothetical protein